MSQITDLDSARRLRRAVDRLPRELRPGRDLWPGIAGRLKERPEPAAASGWWRLAAAVVVTAGGLLAASVLGPVAPPVRPEVSAAAPALAAPHLRQRDGVLHAHNDLVAVIAHRGGRLDPAGAEALAAGLVELESATAEIAAALEARPGDRRLRLALAAAYRRESGWASRLGRA
jgi:hypothetical protein